MKYLLFPILLLINPIPNHPAAETAGCDKNGHYFYAAEYEDEFLIKEQYRSLFDSLIHEPLSDYICNTEIVDLPEVRGFRKKKKGSSYKFEPQFINLENFDGIYAQRIYLNIKYFMNPRFYCGYDHYLCMIANDTYYNLTSDSIQNAQLIETHLSDSFEPREIKMMQKYYNSSSICDHYTTLPVYFIRKGDAILFDAFD